MRSTAFGKITAVYGQIDENGLFVRKWPARKMAITDKMGKNGRLSVKIQPFRPGFTDKCSKKRLVSVILPNAAPDKSARQTISITEGDYHACAKI